MQPAFVPTIGSALVDPTGLVRAMHVLCMSVGADANLALVSKSKKDNKPDPRSGG
ncbi:MAG: hypothetical protein ACI8QC_002374 [Planctomycetota bacterium]|jgi:hypothetical protein